MAYTTITVLTDGALEEERDFPYTPEGDDAIDAFLHEIEFKAHPDRCNCEVQVYRIYHPHDELRQDEECACVQHLSDHAPEFIYNMED